MNRRPLPLALSLLACLGASPYALTAGTAATSSISKSIDEYKNRRIYTTLTPAVLASIPDDKLEQAVFDYALSKINGRYEHERQIVAELASGVRALYITSLVEEEVENGGFNQYYWNSSGQFAADAPQAFEYFAARKHAALMREANAIWLKERPAMQKYKARGTIQAFSDSYKETKLGPLDDRYYKLSDDLSKLRIAKIRSEPAAFSGK
jgi:hypothetical protein